MKIIINELKKIFTLKMTALLLVGSAIFYQMFIAFNINVFPNGRPTLDIYNITVQMLKDYGTEMDESELQDFKDIYQEKLEEADNFLSNNKDFNEVGVYSYEDYVTKSDFHPGQERDQKFVDTMWNYLGKEEGDIFWELQEYPNIISNYENSDNYDLIIRGLEEHEERIKEIISNNENKSIFTYVVFDNYNDIIIYWGVCIIIGIAFMLTPIFLRDKRDKVNYLQYSSKHGRKLFKDKMIAGIITALIITTLELIICFALYRLNNTSMFFKSNINSVLNYGEFLFSLTFKQYILITVAFIYIISIIAAFLSMFISSKVHTYIAAIGIQVPVLFVICELSSKYLLDRVFRLHKIQYIEFITFAVLIIITTILTIKCNKKEKIMDLGN